MSDNAKPTAAAPPEFPFPEAVEANGYRVFPDELEIDPLIAFHGTAAANLPSIIGDGFGFKGELKSLSFAKSSALALGYACGKRSDASPEGCILAVRFQSSNGVEEEASLFHVYRLDRLPAVIGYCIVPATYVHR